MNHLTPFRARTVLSLPTAHSHDWYLKRYAILADGRKFDEAVAASALESAFEQLPCAGRLNDESDNNGVGFQIVHFAEVAVVSPVFYWQWGSVLASIRQLRAPWKNPTAFDTGMEEVVGCVWEMNIVTHEVSAWTDTMLSDGGVSMEPLADYLERRLPSAIPR